MNKILITVIIPAIEEEYNMVIPINIKVATLKAKIISNVLELSNNDMGVKKTFRLFDKANGEDFDDVVYVKNSGIKNGSKLILM